MDNKIKIKNIPVEIQKPENLQPDRFNPRNRIYVRAVKGMHQLLRQRIGFLGMLVFMLLPWLNFNGQQAVLFDLFEQKFNIFGLTLWPQDLTILAFILMIAAFALFLVTTFYGRVWCGYTCPQTVWTFIFIWFEEKCEGSANQRKKLDKRPMDIDKLFRKGMKHFSWSVFSFFTAVTFVGYFTPIRTLLPDLLMFSASGYATVSVVVFAICTYGNAGWMREIMCLHICPYSRFQSAMFDKDTFTVSYDNKRGEGRGPRGRKQDPKELGLGDCIDCKLCVQVCPTGIDIRNGLQYECINCGACIDACDGVMEKMNYAKGLISYTTERNLEHTKKITQPIRMKLIGYVLILFVLSGALVTNIAMRKTFELDIIRDRNQLYRVNYDGMVENTYTLKLINKAQTVQTFSISVAGLEHFELLGKQSATVAAGSTLDIPVSVVMDPYDLTKPVTEFHFVLSSDGQSKSQVSQPTNFFKGR
ncbi:cytochrome c oxidase accessory protein CcoG [Pseudoalteromonas luteoviolacea]|uniref:4Fe-4S ferredoxin n=1 Tax=Pseudoalteromonas luteoviolacea S4054 TaxID=1129367 RepID=A0A0F6A4X2_9GAMM|nr:cytochrome c oxidase accessory protein CcoG [Pseudoalteromonas luteoviolacea]AOT06756.1 cytochrome c oxidase accessory protein CcoG [Pseudoalteromonas luteoviolacea]AOT11674.1 cytochrome c oxidase accessory protein CcoG [Pseudoalteromonas luteoviolacea]AOT16586.1 cytochrome c oxidase accessory protein CcoG [Pseudoalteromonas luteoviolacea]KKE80911.1 4Fe-4S ferredoxin [Pseudoalteromonas luteoviolacea S4054]KZN73870.1 4Fe-4S ferredoxin [Pseudoalteromonas luteoviolacea S4047-1]